MREARYLDAELRTVAASTAAGIVAGLLVVIALVGGTGAPPVPSLTAGGSEGELRAERSYGHLPLAFEPSAGRGDGADFVARTRSGQVSLDASGATIAAGDAGAIQLALAGGTEARPVSIGRLPGVVNDLRGDRPAAWRTGISTFERVRYPGVYPGVAVDWYGNQRNLEYDLRLAPGADAGRIALRVGGADTIRLGPGGDLMIESGGVTLRQRAPIAHQPASGGAPRTPVRAAFEIDGSLIRFRLGAHDSSRPLVIDPLVLGYSTYLGGGAGDSARGIAVDAAGSAYIAGDTLSADFDTLGPVQGDGADSDGFVAKLNRTGDALVYSTYLGGDGSDRAFGVAVDSAGSAYVTGVTESSDFPTANQFEGDDGGADAFASKLNPAGSALLYSTYLGGSSFDWSNSIATGPGGAAYIAGFSLSSDIEAVNSFDGNDGGADVFVARLDTTAAGAGSLDYSTYLGGPGGDIGQAVASDAAGNAYVTGVTQSAAFDLAGAIEGDSPGDDAFVSKIDTNAAGLASLIFSTYLGGDGNDQGNSIATDATGSSYVTGFTGSSDFNTVNPIEGDTPGSLDAFVSKLNPAGAALTYSTYLGGGADEAGKGIAVDAAGSAYVAGTTESGNLDTADPIDTPGGGEDAFAASLTPAGSALEWSTYLSGAYEDEGNAIAIDPSGAAYVGGHTISADFPTAGPIEGDGDAGATDAFVARLVVTGTCGRARPTMAGTPGDDTITGTDGPDVIDGLGGADTIDGRGGKDVICGRDGNDRLKGGKGRDRIKAGDGRDSAKGGNANDKLKGGKGNDRLFGNKGNDRLFGQGGKDLLRGGPGNDKEVQ